MKITVILKDFTESFYDGFGQSIIGLFHMADKEKLEKLITMGHDKRVSVKIGNGSFNDHVELNQMRRGNYTVSFKIEPRKGYKLVTFDVAKWAAK